MLFNKAYYGYYRFDKDQVSQLVFSKLAATLAHSLPGIYQSLVEQNSEGTVRASVIEFLQNYMDTIKFMNLIALNLSKRRTVNGAKMYQNLFQMHLSLEGFFAQSTKESANVFNQLNREMIRVRNVFSDTNEAEYNQDRIFVPNMMHEGYNAAFSDCLHATSDLLSGVSIEVSKLKI